MQTGMQNLMMPMLHADPGFKGRWICPQAIITTSVIGLNMRGVMDVRPLVRVTVSMAMCNRQCSFCIVVLR
jgi:hypothetical protein